MTKKKPSTKAAVEESQPKPAEPRKDGVRETVESVVIAFVLAFLFRTFEAEAFVIPTGSMAPTLMGRHKDLACANCGFEYQVNASDEVDKTSNRQRKYRGTNEPVTVMSSTCPICRYTMDIAHGKPARIGVSKLQGRPHPGDEVQLPVQRSRPVGRGGVQVSGRGNRQLHQARWWGCRTKLLRSTTATCGPVTSRNQNSTSQGSRPTKCGRRCRWCMTTTWMIRVGCSHRTGVAGSRKREAGNPRTMARHSSPVDNRPTRAVGCGFTILFPPMKSGRPWVKVGDRSPRPLGSWSRISPPTTPTGPTSMTHRFEMLKLRGKADRA